MFMKFTLQTSILGLALVTTLHAGPRSSTNYGIAAETSDAGGQRTSSANYKNDGSVGLVAGISTVGSPAGTAKAGYIAQLYDVSGLVVNSAAPDVNESDTLQLAAWQLLDDATFLATNAGAVTWGIVAGPIVDISANGLLTAGLVFENTPASVEGTLSSFTGAMNFTVLDTIPDNFGSYAGDGIGDDWQVQYFGQNNPLAAPGLDPDGDGGNNLFEFTAGLVPTDPASVFRLRLEAVPGQPTRKNLIFNPRLDGRTYVVKALPAIESGSWQPLATFNQSDNGAERTVTDLNATGAKKFYRVEITRP
jgi:hypothetical protein